MRIRAAITERQSEACTGLAHLCSERTVLDQDASKPQKREAHPAVLRVLTRVSAVESPRGQEPGKALLWCLAGQQGSGGANCLALRCIKRARNKRQDWGQASAARASCL